MKPSFFLGHIYKNQDSTFTITNFEHTVTLLERATKTEMFDFVESNADYEIENPNIATIIRWSDGKIKGLVGLSEKTTHFLTA